MNKLCKSTKISEMKGIKFNRNIYKVFLVIGARIGVFYTIFATV